MTCRSGTVGEANRTGTPVWGGEEAALHRPRLVCTVGLHGRSAR